MVDKESKKQKTGLKKLKIGAMRSTKEKKDRKIIKIKSFEGLNVLSKLRLVITLIFVLSTVSILLVTTDFVISVALILISYFMLFILMLKLLFVKKL